MALFTRDLTSPRWLAIKGVLFALLGAMATCVLGLSLAVDAGAGLPSVMLLGLHLLSVWAFCRAYYFAFYVIEKYVEPGKRYAGLGAAVRLTIGMLRHDGEKKG